MLLKVSVTLILGLVAVQQTHAQNACREYFDDIAIFLPQQFGLKYANEYPGLLFQRTPMQIYALEVEAQNILNGLKSKKPNYSPLRRYKNATQSSGWYTQIETKTSLSDRLRDLLSELGATAMNSKAKSSEISDHDRAQINLAYKEKANAILESLKEEVKAYEDLAYRLDFILPDMQNISGEAKSLYDLYREGNLRALLLYKRYLPYFEAHSKHASNLLETTLPVTMNFGTEENPIIIDDVQLSPTRISLKHLGITQSQSQVDSSPRVIRDTPTQRDPRQERYSKSWEPSQRAPAPERVLPPNHPDVIRQRYSQTPTYALPPASSAKAEVIATTLRYEVSLSVRPSRIPGAPAYRDVVATYREWAKQNNLSDSIHFTHTGSANAPMIVTLTDRAPLGTFEKFQTAFSSQISRVTEAGTPKTVSYYNLRIRAHDPSGAKRTPEEINRRLEEWLSLNGLSKSEVQIRFTPGSSDSIVQLHIFSNRTDKILQKLMSDFAWMSPETQKTTQIISPFVEKEDLNY